MINPNDLLGEAVEIYLKAGGYFYFKVTECEIKFSPGEPLDWKISGFDDEGLNITLYKEDIDFVIKNREVIK